MPRLSVGEKMPDFTFRTAYKDNQKISDVLKGKTVFWVLRYIGCTVCRYDVHVIAQRYQEFLDRNAQVYVVMQSDPEHVRKDLESSQEKLPFEIICDSDQLIYNTLDIKPAASKLKLAGGSLMKLVQKGREAGKAGFAHGDYEGNELQLPAMFIVEEDGTVSYARYAKNIVDMPTVDEVLKLLDA